MNKEIKREGQGATQIFDERTVEADYATLIPILKTGMRVLDVGCGTGAISKGIARYVGESGYVIGIDNTERFIQSGRESYKAVTNLELIYTDLFSFKPEQKFDLIVGARVLQWLSNPKEALMLLKELLKPNGQISILDYNHDALEWTPDPPQSMVKFYKTFLKWRADAGMNNQIAEDLHIYFSQLGFKGIQVFNSNEVYKRGEPNFMSKVGIWSKVAASSQMVDEGYISDEDRIRAIEEYNMWIDTDAEMMIMKLKEVRGKI